MSTLKFPSSKAKHILDFERMAYEPLVQSLIAEIDNDYPMSIENPERWGAMISVLRKRAVTPFLDIMLDDLEKNGPFANQSVVR